jgi:hypothetical protein
MLTDSFVLRLSGLVLTRGFLVTELPGSGDQLCPAFSTRLAVISIPFVICSLPFAVLVLSNDKKNGGRILLLEYHNLSFK